MDQTPAGQRLQELILPGAGGEPQVLDVLYEVEDDDRALRLSVTSDRMRAYLEYTAKSLAGFPNPDQLEAEVRRAGICFGIEREGLEMLVRLLKQATGKVGPVQIAYGIPAVPGTDGGLEFLVRPLSDEAHYDADAGGKIDFRQTRRIENAYAGRDIAILRDPGTGKPGRTVFAATVPAEDGSRLKVHLGENVHFDEETRRFRAETDGVVVFRANQLSVSPRYVIDGDVTLAVGNIDFVGELVVKGSVPDDFALRGRKGVVVEGTVEGAQIFSDGEIRLKGGVAGKGKARIFSEKGMVHAKYLDEAQVLSLKGVRVQREILNARINTAGSVRIPSGSIIGGEINAFGGVEAGTIGSPMGVITQISSGLDWQSETRIDLLEERKERIEHYIAEIEAAIQPLVADTDRLKAFRQERRLSIKTGADSLKALLAKRSEIEEEIDTLRREKKEGSVIQINVRQTLHNGVMVRLGPMMELYKNEFTGPLSIGLHPSGERVDVLSFTPLPAPDGEPSGEEEPAPGEADGA